METKSELADFTQTILPAAEVAAALFGAINPQLGVTMAIATAATLPLKYWLASITQIEANRVINYMQYLSYEISQLKNQPSMADFLKSSEGQHLIKVGAQAAAGNGGSNRIKVIAKITANGNSQISYAYSAEDFIGIIDDLSEIEVTILFEAYQIYGPKDSIGKPRNGKITAPSVLQWTELHSKFPNLNPFELNAIFSRLQRTGLVSREQGFLDDSGDCYAFTPLMSSLYNGISRTHQNYNSTGA